jgi:hypothetical protein
MVPVYRVHAAVVNFGKDMDVKIGKIITAIGGYIGA